MHIIPLSENLYEIGIHIADPSHFIQVDDPIDIQAKTRMMSQYLGNNMISSMVPWLLYSNVCSLLQEEKRLTLTLTFNMDSEGLVADESIKIRPSVIKNYHRLDYKKVEEQMDALMDSSKQTESKVDKIYEDIVLMYKLALKRKDIRERQGYGNSDLDLDERI